MSNGRKKRFSQIGLISFYEVHPYLYDPSLKEYRNKDMKRTLEAEIASKMGKTGWGGSRILVWGHALRQGHREFPFRKSFSSPPLSVKIPENSRYDNTAYTSRA